MKLPSALPTLALAAALAGTGCLSLGGPALEPRYFSATPFVLDAELPAAPEAVEVRVGGFTPAEHLRERFVWSDGRGELGFREELRWAEDPGTILGRAFRDVRDRGGDVGPLPTVRVDGTLLAFEERRGPEGRAALVEVDARFTSGAGAFLGARRIRVERPLVGDDPAQLVAELGAAAAEVARRTVAHAVELGAALDDAR